MPTLSKKINDGKENRIARYHGGLQDALGSFGIDVGDAGRIEAAHLATLTVMTFCRTR
jgi:hypothetical protein